MMVSSQITTARTTEEATFECVNSFEYYAYGMQGFEISSDDELHVQWQPRYEIARIIVDGTEIRYDGAEVVFSRIRDDRQEVWVKL